MDQIINIVAKENKIDLDDLSIIKFKKYEHEHNPNMGVRKRLSCWLNNIDLFGAGFNFVLNTHKSTVTTSFGGVMTIMCFILTLLYTTSGVIDIYQRRRTIYR